MTKFGTPIGAGPKSATVSPGFVAAGAPLASRSAGGATSPGAVGACSTPSSSALSCRDAARRGALRPGPATATGGRRGLGRVLDRVVAGRRRRRRSGGGRGRRRGLRRRGFVVAPRKVDTRAAGEVDVRVASAARAPGEVDPPAARERHPAAPVLVREIDADPAGEVDVVAAAAEDLGADGRRRADNDRHCDRDEENSPPGHLVSTAPYVGHRTRRPLALTAPLHYPQRRG